MNDRGITLIELIVAISIITILVIAAGITIPGLVGKYNIERQTKELYGDLMNARMRAMQRNRLHFVALTATGYTIYEDTNPAPDGDGTLNIATDTRIAQRSIDTRYPIVWTTNATIALTTRGIVNDMGTIRVNPVDATLDPEYNCIVVFTTRINIGKWDGADCDAK